VKQRITWDEFEIFQHCPQWFHRSVRLGQPGVDHRDIQHLVRKNAAQALMDRWVIEGWSERPQAASDELIVRGVLEEVQKALYQTPGNTTVDRWFIAETLRDGLLESTKVFKDFMVQRGGVRSFTIEAKHGFSTDPSDYPTLTLHSSPDFILTPLDGYVTLIEGKATRNPKKVKPDQLFWHYWITQNYRVFLEKTHFYLFYTTGELKPVEIEEKSYGKWLSKAERSIDLLAAGEENTTPGSRQCSLCPHRYACDDRHVPKRRFEPEFDIPEGPKTLVLG